MDKKDGMIRKGEMIRIKAEDISDRGEGIGKLDGFTWFVDGMVPGDVADAKVTEIKKTYGHAEAVNMITPSPYRVTPRCPYFSDCGGCQLQALDYPAQLKFKEDRILNQLKRIGEFDDADSLLRPVTGMEDPWRYRDNEQFYPGTDEEGRMTFGFYAGHTHKVSGQDDCLIGIKENAPILGCIKDHSEKYNLKPYDEKTKSGLISRVQIRKGFATGDILVCLDVRGKVSALKGQEELVQKLCSLFAGGKDAAHISSICCRSADEKTGGRGRMQTVNIYGPGYITDMISGLKFQISPDSFYQVNPLQTERLCKTVLDFAGLTGKETVWDLYCGIGTISLFLAGKAGWVYGVEILPQAVDDARANARRNGVGNVSFFAGKAEVILPEQFEKDHIRADVMVVDPPRKGCARSCLDTMIKMRPLRIVYVSCDSGTLARDLKILREGGYELKAVQPIDAFAQTVHIETVALLQR